MKRRKLGKSGLEVSRGPEAKRSCDSALDLYSVAARLIILRRTTGGISMRATLTWAAQDL
jgi:hypothetical protein